MFLNIKCVYLAYTLLTLINPQATKRIFTVRTVQELQDTLNTKANASDTILLANGNYSASFKLTIPVNKQGITVQAKTLGQVIFTGSAHILLNGNNNTLSGFQFIGNPSAQAAKNVIEINGNYNTISHCNWSNYAAKRYIHVSAETRYNTISYCNMENKPVTAPLGSLIQLLPSKDGNYHRITHCTFQNMPGSGGDFGNEPIRIGLGAVSSQLSRSIVEYSYWRNTGLADSESISVKSAENVIRFNVFEKNRGGKVVFRMGNRNIAYGNIFLGESSGVRIKEANDILCFNNYFDSLNHENKSENQVMLAFDYVNSSYLN